MLGEYPSILDLVRILEYGKISKYQLDLLIDSQQFKQFTLKEKMLKYYQEARILQQNLTHRVESRVKRANSLPNISENTKYFQFETAIKKYLQLIVFSEYLICKLHAVVAIDNYADWLKCRPEIKFISERFPEELNNVNEIPTKDVPEEIKVIFNRTGQVLSRGTLLKSDHFPDCFMLKLPCIPGTPNFRQVEGFPVRSFFHPAEKRSDFSLICRCTAWDNPLPMAFPK